MFNPLESNACRGKSAFFLLPIPLEPMQMRKVIFFQSSLLIGSYGVWKMFISKLNVSVSFVLSVDRIFCSFCSNDQKKANLVALIFGITIWILHQIPSDSLPAFKSF